MIPFTMNTRAFWVYRWLVWFWYAKILRRSDKVCHPDCGLCAVQMRMNDHYNACVVCQADERECPTFTTLRVEEDRVTEELFPWTKYYKGTATLTTTNTTASNYPVQVFPPWDLSK